MKNLGRLAETRAAKYLEHLNYNILERNWHSSLAPYRKKGKGEIDIIAQSPGGQLIFVEVKARNGAKYSPEKAVNKSKQASLKSLCESYIYRYQKIDSVVRFDVIALNRIHNYWKIKHIIGAF